jgi:hypothetical protein
MTTTPVRYLGIYDADGGLTGELRYIIGHLLGTAECALCDITHSPVRRKPAWDRMVATLGVPFDLRHRNELTASEQAATASMGLPVVAAELTDGRLIPVLDAAALAACDGDPDRLRAGLVSAAPPPPLRPQP